MIKINVEYIYIYKIPIFFCINIKFTCFNTTIGQQAGKVSLPPLVVLCTGDEDGVLIDDIVTKPDQSSKDSDNEGI